MSDLPALPTSRGPLSSAVVEYFRGRPGLPDRIELDIAQVLSDDDFQLALYCCYELHYRGFDIGMDAEWDPELLAFRRMLEVRFEAALLDAVALDAVDGGDGASNRLRRIIADADGPSLSTFVEVEGERWHLQEFAIHRSLYQLKEADAHTWGIPRFIGPARSALIEIQMDEYGYGVPGAAHSELFAVTMTELGLDPTYGAYLDSVGATTMATTNLISLFGLHRRLLPALLGHLAVFENTSVQPMSRYARACEGLGIGPAGSHFYEVHVTADEHHGPLAANQMVGGYVAEHPEAEDLVMWGASCLMELEARFAASVLAAWSDGSSSLLGAITPTGSPASAGGPGTAQDTHFTSGSRS